MSAHTVIRHACEWKGATCVGQSPASEATYEGCMYVCRACLPASRAANPHALKKGARVDTAWGPAVVVDVATYAGEALVRPSKSSMWGSVFDRTHGRWVPVAELSPAQCWLCDAPAVAVEGSDAVCGEHQDLPVTKVGAAEVSALEAIAQTPSEGGVRRVTNPFRLLNVGALVGAEWWGVPAYAVQEWLDSELSKPAPNYGDVAAYSALLHAPHESDIFESASGGVSLVKATRESVSALCPNVLTGCSHTMVQNTEGVGVACAEWADAHGIEWRQSPAPAAQGESRDPGFAVESLPARVVRGLDRNDPDVLREAFGWFAPGPLAPRGLSEGEWSY
jgi:hypothetical protein